MCFYGFVSHKWHYACVTCRVSFKQERGPERRHVCPRCARPLVCAGPDFAPPRRRDVRAWSVVAAVLAEGLRYDGKSPCGCDREPKYRPRRRSELRARLIAATRAGLPPAETLSRADPLTPAKR